MTPPWANLTAKFQDVIDEIRALKLEQQATNAKLDLLIAKDYTIAGDVIADMLGVETRLDAIKAALVGTSPDTTDIRAAIWGLAGPAPGRTLADIHAALIGTGTDATDIRQAIWNLAGPAPGVSLAQLYALWAPTGEDLRPYGHLSNIALDMLLMRQILADYKDTFGDRGLGMTYYNMVDQMNVNLAGLLQDADAINAAIGGSPHQSLEIASVRGLLNALRQCACSKNDGPPLTGEDAVCASPYESDAMMVLPWSLIGGTSVMFAVWPDPPPSGLSFGSTFGIGEDRGELVSSNWANWRVWVASEAAQFAMDGGVTRYPTNQWIQMSGSGSRAFSVDARYGVQVTLCGDRVSWNFGIGGFWDGSPNGTQEIINGTIYACSANNECTLIWSGPHTLTKTANDGSLERLIIPIPSGTHHITYDVWTNNNSLNMGISSNTDQGMGMTLNVRRTDTYILS